MKKKRSGVDELLTKFHSTCTGVIFDGLGIVEMDNSDLFISLWYVAAIFLAYSIRIVRVGINCHSVFTLTMTIILISLLSLKGLNHGHFKNRIPGIKKKNIDVGSKNEK